MATRKRPVTPAAKVEMKTYVLEICSDTYGRATQRKKVTLPASWKITYGPAAQGAHLSTSNPFVLRFYEGNKDNMRALFNNVVSFRDTSIKVEEEIDKSQTETLYRDTPNGRKQVVVEGHVREWRDADVPHDYVDRDRAFLQSPSVLQPVYTPQPVPPPGPFVPPQPGYPR